MIHLEATHLLAVDTAQAAVKRATLSWEWYVVRASGFLAAGLVFLLMISGIGQVTGYTYKFLEPLKAWALHKAMGLALLGAIAVHVIFIVIDNYTHFTIPQVLVPFLSNYTTGSTIFGIKLGTLGITLGIVAMYGIILIVASSLKWIDTRKKIWKWIHYISYPVVFMIFIHAIYVGADLKDGGIRAAWTIAMLVILIAIISRLRRAGSLKRED